MNDSREADRLIVQQIRSGDTGSWEQLIAKYEGRLLAFARSRLGRRGAAEDVVQESFIGFLTSLPNFDENRNLESYLFSICAHKLTDHLRREGRRPALPFSVAKGTSSESLHLPAAGRGPSSIVRQDERRDLEENSLADAVTELVDRFKKRGDWTKLKCLELIFLRGKANKAVAEELEITEQQVANFKFDFLTQLRKGVRKQSLSPDVFPELYET